MRRSADQYYLYKVLGLSAFPRVVTFSLTLFSFPLLVRGLGADQYGIFIFVSSLVGLLELVASAGVSSAVGKALADCRINRPQDLGSELIEWLKLQGIVCLATLGPVLGLGYLLIGWNTSRSEEFAIFLPIMGATYISIFIAFGRAVLNSLLAFKRLAVLDSAESILRSSGWIIVGLYFPTSMGLALAGLGTAIVVLVILVALMLVMFRSGSYVVRKQNCSRKQMLRESASFLALTTVTRAYQTLPILLVGRILGFETTGIIGAFAKITEIMALPFTIVGNALMVRAPEIKKNGIEVLRRYWNMLFRLTVFALVATIGFWFVSAEVARLMLPQSDLARELFPILSIMILSRAASDLFAPASDYVGGLRKRIIFLGICTVLQLPAIWFGAQFGSTSGAIVAIVGSYALMVLGYMAIAKRVFFGSAAYDPPRDVFWAFLLCWLLAVPVFATASGHEVRAIAFLVLVTTCFALIPLFRATLAPAKLLKFDFS